MYCRLKFPTSGGSTERKVRKEKSMSISIYPEVTTPTVAAGGGIALLYLGNPVGWLIVCLSLATFLGWKYITAV